MKKKTLIHTLPYKRSMLCVYISHPRVRDAITFFEQRTYTTNYTQARIVEPP